MRINTALNKRIKTLSTGRRAAVISIAAAAAAVVLSFVLIINTDPTGELTPKITGEMSSPSRFFHYAGFNAAPDGSVSLSTKRTRLRLDDSGSAQLKLYARIFPADRDNKKIEYTSSDSAAASVDENGTVTPHKPGKVTITASLAGSGSKSSAEIEIIRPVTGVMLKESALTLNVSDSAHLMEAVVSPGDATNTAVTWTSKDTSVAEIDENGALKPVGAGMTEITATTEDGGFTAKCFVTVVNDVIGVDSISIQNKGSAKLGVGESMNMIVTVSPQNAKNKAVTWSSSDERVAEISATGRLKALSEGTSKITVRAANGKSDEFELTVSKAAGESALNLYGKVTSDDTIPTDILGSTYVAGAGGTTAAGRGGTTYTSYNITLDDIVDIQMGLSPAPKIWRGGGSVSASRDEVREYMDPSSFCTGAYKYQFLDLSQTNGVSAEALNRFLEGKGILEGTGQAFIDAANANNISEVYLVAHACLETGNGTSTLSTGVNVNGTTVYNMFGIAAYDDSALYSGSRKAYSEGWTSPEAAIKGGAAWISEWYINASSSRQNTLYKMLFNPETPGVHQYATDISWAVKQAASIEAIFAQFPEAVLSYDIPVYLGETAIVIE